MNPNSIFLVTFLLFTSAAFGQRSQPIITASKINNVYYVGTKYTTIQACIDAVTDPGICLIPSNVPSAAVWKTPPDYVLIEDHRFTNGPGFLAGTLSGQKAHLYYEFHAGPNDSYELAADPSGPIGININAYADAGGGLGIGQANVVGLQIGAKRSPFSTRPTWGEDINTGCYNTTSNTALCTAIETDIVNFGPANDITYNVIGIKNIADGNYISGIGIANTSTRPGTNGWGIAGLFANWLNVGVQISNGIGGGVALSIGTLGAGSKAIAIQPPDDTMAVEVFGYDSLAATSVWSIDNRGDSNWLAVRARSFVSSPAYRTSTNCSSVASPAACGSASAGSVVVAASAKTVEVDTAVVTGNSQIVLTFDSSLGLRLGTICNTTFDQPYVTARAPGKSFTIAVLSSPAKNPACVSYEILN